MKYLQITPATSTEPGLCVQPTMEKPELKNCLNPHNEKSYQDFKAHIEFLPRLPTTCTLPAGEWFEGEEDWRWINNGYEDFKKYGDWSGGPQMVIVPVEQKEDGVVNYMHTIPDSHFWSSVEMLMRDVARYRDGDMNANYLLIGLQNTLNQGYQLSKVEPQPAQPVEQKDDLDTGGSESNYR